MALVIIIGGGGGGGGGDAVGEPWHAQIALAGGIDVSGGDFTEVNPLGAEGNPIFPGPAPRALAVGFNVLVTSGDDAGLWLVTLAGPCVRLEDQPQPGGLVLVAIGAADTSPRLYVGGNELGDPSEPNSIYVPLGVSLYARTDQENEFTQSQTITKEIEVRAVPADGNEPIDQIVTANVVVNSEKHRAGFLGSTAVDFGIVVVNSGAFFDEYDPFTGFTGRLAFASYGFSGFTEAFEPIFRWRFGIAADNKVGSLFGSSLVPVQAGAPTEDDDLTPKSWVLARLDEKQAMKPPESAYGSLTASDTTPIVVPHTAACFEIFSAVTNSDTLEISYDFPDGKMVSMSTLRLVNGDTPPQAWSFGSDVEASHEPDLRPGASTTYAAYIFGGDTPKVFLSRVAVTEPPPAEPDPVWQPVIPTDPYVNTISAADLIAAYSMDSSVAWEIDPAVSRHTIQINEGDDVTIFPFNFIPVRVANPGPNKFVKLAINIVNANSTNGVALGIIDATTGAPAGGVSVNKQGAYALDVFGGDPGFTVLWAYRVGISPI